MSDPGPAPTPTPPKRKARQLAKHLRGENPDYAYLKAVFRHLRAELDVDVQREPKRLPYVPSEAEIRRYYDVVWTARKGQDIVLIKTLLFTGVRVSELVRIRIVEVDLDACRIRITQGKGAKDRTVPFPSSFKETLALHIDTQHAKAATFLFESSWKKPYSTRGVRALLARYAEKAGLEHNMPPHRLRHFLFTWLKTQGIDDAAIQPYSGHASRASLEIYSRIALSDAQKRYDEVIDRFPGFVNPGWPHCAHLIWPHLRVSPGRRHWVHRGLCSDWNGARLCVVTESTEVPPKAGRIVIDWVVGHDPDDFDTYGWRLQCDPKLPDEVVVALLAEVLKVY